MKLSKIHHIAIIGTDYNKTTDFYINILKFEKISEYNRPEKNDILLNVKKGDIVLEIFIKKDAPLRPPMPSPEYTGLRHLAFRVDSVEDIVHEGLRYDDYDGKKMAFFFDPDGLPLEIHE